MSVWCGLPSIHVQYRKELKWEATRNVMFQADMVIEREKVEGELFCHMFHKQYYHGSLKQNEQLMTESLFLADPIILYFFLKFFSSCLSVWPDLRWSTKSEHCQWQRCNSLHSMRCNQRASGLHTLMTPVINPFHPSEPLYSTCDSNQAHAEICCVAFYSTWKGDTW